MCNQTAAKAFEDEIRQQKLEWDEEEAERASTAQEEAISAALAANPGMDPEDVPAVGIIPRIFLCQRTLERCLNKVVSVILPSDAVLQQEQYMKSTTKPRKMSSKQWINRLQEMKGEMYWMDETNYEMDARTLNLECVVKNLPLEWRIDFEKSDVCTKIKRCINKKQPRASEIISQLEQIERAEAIRQEIDIIRSRRDRNNRRGNGNQYNNRNGNGKKNMCRKSGHNHEWKDCPDNPRQRNQENNSNDRDDDSRDDREIEDRDQFIIEESEDEMFLIEEDQAGPTLFDEEDDEITELAVRISDSDRDDSKNEVDPTDRDEEKPDKESEVNNSEETNIVNNIRAIKTQTNEITSNKVRVSCIFSLKNKKGERKEYLGLLDTGSTRGLINEDVVQDHELETEDDNGSWNTNTGKFRKIFGNIMIF